MRCAARCTLGLILFTSSLASPSRLLAAGPPCNPATKRYALVIGNSYSGTERVSGRKDAETMGSYLCELGFNVLSPVYNGTGERMRLALTELEGKIGDAEVVLFFYSGHGFQYNDVNYFLPINFTVDLSRLDLNISLDEVMRSLSKAPDPASKLVFLDACRTSAEVRVENGGVLGTVQGWREGLAKPPENAPKRTLFAYAASYNQPAVSGPPNGYSPYTAALLESIREPGLEIRDLLARVHAEVLKKTKRRQTPKEEGIGALPDRLYLRPPVSVTMKIGQADDDLLVLLNGEVVRSFRQNQEALAEGRELAPVELKAGENDLLLMVYNQRSYRNAQVWNKAEGWNYQLQLSRPDGSIRIVGQDGGRYRCPNGQDICLQGGEEVPFKDGPHHGELFEVASAVLNVDRQTAELTIRDLDTEIWNLYAPFWARDQEILDCRKIPLLSNAYFVVRGNRLLAGVAKECVNRQLADPSRLLDLAGRVFAGDRAPFDGFLAELKNCARTPLAAGLENIEPEECVIRR